MGFNDQAKVLTGARGARKFIFKDGVRYKHMTGQQPIVFRLMPSFNPQDANPATSYLPCLDPAGNLTEWGAFLKIVRFVGHGKGGSGSRQDLLSLKTFETDGHPRWCPLDALYSTIVADPNTWGYLIDDGDRKDKNRQRAAFNRAANHLICNILDINGTQLGVQLGVFTQGASNKLIDRKDGLVYQPNAAPNAEEVAKQNYMWAYANGDMTCPNYAPVLVVEKGDDKGEFSAYKISIAQDQSRRIIRRQVDQTLMAQRYNLATYGIPEQSFLNIPSEEDLVQSLIQLLNGRSPLGYHEHALLKIAFPNFQIPEPPAAPGAMHSVQSGFAPAPAAAPGMIPGAVPGFGVPPAPPIPAYGGVPPAAPVPGPQYQSVPGVGVVGGSPGFQVAPPAAQAAGPVVGQQVQGVMANAQQAEPAAQSAAQSASNVVAPGDTLAPGFAQGDFLARIRAGK
jgi:hypothetical protein